jgi:hypothetical protein
MVVTTSLGGIPFIEEDSPVVGIVRNQELFGTFVVVEALGFNTYLAWQTLVPFVYCIKVCHSFFVDFDNFASSLPLAPFLVVG